MMSDDARFGLVTHAPDYDYPMNLFNELRAFVRSAHARAALAAIVTGSALAACSAPPRARAVSAAGLCVDIPLDERAHPSFLTKNGIAAVAPATGERRLVKSWTTELRGAELHVRARPGLTKQWIARVVRCHIAFETENRSNRGVASDDVLVDGSPTVAFDEDEDGFIVRVTGADRGQGEAILARATRIAAAR